MKKSSYLGIVLTVLVLFSASTSLFLGGDEPDEHWFRRYNGFESYNDDAFAIADLPP